MKCFFILWRCFQEQDGAGRKAASLADMFHPDRNKQTPLFLSRRGQAQLADGCKACK